VHDRKVQAAASPARGVILIEHPNGTLFGQQTYHKPPIDAGSWHGISMPGIMEINYLIECYRIVVDPVASILPSA
jgi:hypothetical protein